MVFKIFTKSKTATAFPKEVENYRRFGVSALKLPENEIPISVYYRKPTDKYFLLAFLACVLIWIPLLAYEYTFCYADINQLIKGYVSDVSSVTKTPSTIRNDSANFVRSDYGMARDYTDDFRYRDLSIIKNTEKENFIDSLDRVGWKLAMSCLVSIVLCQATVLCFRYATAVTVWTILIVSWIFLFGLGVILWKMALKSGDNMIGVIFYSVGLLVLFCIMVFMRSRVRLTIMLIKESCKAVFDIPTTFIIPLLTIFGTLILIAVGGILTISMLSAVSFEDVTFKAVSHYRNEIQNSIFFLPIFSIIFNVIMGLWCVEIMYGIQYMIISGAISKWYFTRDKNLLVNPVKTSARTTIRFHLGSIIMGALILTLVTILQFTLSALAHNPRLKAIINYCIKYLENILRIFTKNAYIITGLHGTSFYKSGKKAVELIKLNVCNIFVLNSVSNFVMKMASVFLMAICGTLTAYVFWVSEKDNFEDYWIYYVIIVVIVTGITSYTVLGTIETSVDAMYICFCEDSLMNNGVDQPYFMTRGLMEFIESSKVHFANTIQKKGLPTI